MTGYLSTHVLDTMHGIPASDVKIELWKLDGTAGRTLLKTVHTNENGRTDAPLLAGEHFVTGTYELLFAIGHYFMQHQSHLPKPVFLDIVPVRFGIADASEHYHVPLLVSPWAYSTYRGS
jgi:5-hydroxyisourate hydrolase